MTARAQWLAARRISGSRCAAILGIHPYRTPLEAYADIVAALDGEPGQPDDAIKRRGRRLEPVVAAEYAEITGERLIPAPPFKALVHPDRPLVTATLDFQRARDAAPVEIKTSALAEDWDDGPPVYVRSQAQWQLGILAAIDRGFGISSRKTVVIVAWVFGFRGPDLRSWEYDLDTEWLDGAYAHTEQWWAAHVVERRPPLPGHSVGDRRVLRALYGSEGGGHAVVLPRWISPMAQQLTAARQVAKVADRQESEAKNAIFAALGRATYGVIAGRGTILSRAGGRLTTRKKPPQGVPGPYPGDRWTPPAGEG